MVNSGVDISDIYENASEHYATIDQEFVIFNIIIGQGQVTTRTESGTNTK